MEMFSYLMATGISTGALYALVALGLVVIYKATSVVNFAHGEMFMLGGFLAFTFHVLWGWQYIVALVLAVQKMREQGQIKTMPVLDHVAATSVGVVQATLMLDLAYSEDSTAEVDMNVIKTGDGRYIEVQGTAEGAPFGRDALDQLLGLADDGITQLIALQREIVGEYLTKA